MFDDDWSHVCEKVTSIDKLQASGGGVGESTLGRSKSVIYYHCPSIHPFYFMCQQYW